MTEANLYLLDAAYKAFPTFEQWSAQTTVDTVRWTRYNAALDARKDVSPEVLKRARETAKRAAALDTGAIEGLYDVDQGFTYTVAFETAAWEVALAAKGEQVRSLFEAQLHAYDYVLSIATKQQPVSEAAIRVLHEEVCRAQPTYRVMTSVGPQEQPFPKGQYKSLPNHVRTRKGADHSYAPVDVTPEEMNRLVQELRSESFLAAHPVIQAAYAHYAFVVIHPFADGNGRVARALASAFTYRAISMPIVILSEQKDSYLDALGEADEGNYQAFVDFMLARSLDTIELVGESIRSACYKSPEQSISTISSLYETKGGYTYEMVDGMGESLIDWIREDLQRAISRDLHPKLKWSTSIDYTGRDAGFGSDHHRHSDKGILRLSVVVSAQMPAIASLRRNYALALPRNAGSEDDIQVIGEEYNDSFTARMDEVFPKPTGILTMRIAMFAERVMAEMLEELVPLAADSAKRNL